MYGIINVTATQKGKDFLSYPGNAQKSKKK